MKTREEQLAYKRAWNAIYLKSEKYEQRKAEARAKTAAYRQSDEYRQHLEKRRSEKQELKRARDRRYRERANKAEPGAIAARARAWRQENKRVVAGYARKASAARAAQKRKARGELRDWYIKEQLGVRNPPQALIEAKRLHNRIKKLLEDANEQHRKAA